MTWQDEPRKEPPQNASDRRMREIQRLVNKPLPLMTQLINCLGNNCLIVIVLLLLALVIWNQLSTH